MKESFKKSPKPKPKKESSKKSPQPKKESSKKNSIVKPDGTGSAITKSSKSKSSLTIKGRLLMKSKRYFGNSSCSSTNGSSGSQADSEGGSLFDFEESKEEG